MTQLSKLKKLETFSKDKGLAILQQMMEMMDSFQEIQEKLSEMTGNIEAGKLQVKLIAEPGKPGNDGHTPTDDELLEIIRPLIPTVKDGQDGHTPTRDELLALIRPLIPQVKDGETPSDERLLELIRPLIPEVHNGEDGKDGSPDTPEQIREKLMSLKDDDRLDASAIKGLKDYGEEIRSNMERALSILDQRTKFLINKSTGSNIATDTFTTTGGAETITLTRAPVLVLVVDVNGQVLNVAAGDYTVSGTSLNLLNASIPSGLYGKIAYTF